MATTSSRADTQLGAWGRFKRLLSRGGIPYVLISIYAVVVSVMLILNPATSLLTDILFVLFLGIVLVTYRAPVKLAFKVLIIGVVLGLIMPYFGTTNQFYMDVVTQVGIFVVLALGLNVVVGFAGLLDLGYVAFYAVGAYLWAIFSTGQAANIFPQWADSFPLAPGWFFVFLLLGLIVGAFTGMLLGLPVLRLRGDYLAIVTLGFGEVIRVLATNLDRPINITNGAQGIKSIGRPPLFVDAPLTIGSVVLDRGQLYQLYFYFLVIIVLAFTVWVVYRLSRSRIGRAWTAIREDETAAIAMGIPLVRMKLLAFAFGASFASVMGVIFSSKQLFINPPTFDLIRSISILSMVILGGMGSIPGVILGGALVTLLNLQLLPRLANELSSLRDLPGIGGIIGQFDPVQYQRMIFGMLLIVMTIFRPEGILPEDRRRQELRHTEPDIVEDDEADATEPDIDLKT